MKIVMKNNPRYCHQLWPLVLKYLFFDNDTFLLRRIFYTRSKEIVELRRAPNIRSRKYNNPTLASEKIPSSDAREKSEKRRTRKHDFKAFEPPLPTRRRRPYFSKRVNNSPFSWCVWSSMQLHSGTQPSTWSCKTLSSFNLGLKGKVVGSQSWYDYVTLSQPHRRAIKSPSESLS